MGMVGLRGRTRSRNGGPGGLEAGSARGYRSLRRQKSDMSWFLEFAQKLVPRFQRVVSYWVNFRLLCP